MSASAATLIAMGKARVIPTVNANATSAAEAAHEGGAAATAAAGVAAGGRAETGEVRKLHAEISGSRAEAHVGQLLKADRRAGDVTVGPGGLLASFANC